MHTVWKGGISFGLVNIPVKLFTATENKDIKLRQLHKECHTPINYKKVCANCGEEVAPEQIVKAYEFAKNKFIELDEEELERLRKENEEKAVEIIDFVKIEEIDPIYYERSYFLSPDTGGAKAYSLLRKALQESGKIGVAKIMIRSKEQLAIVRCYEHILLMETIHFPDEIRQVSDVPNIPQEENIVKKELDTALLLIEQLTTTFDPAAYRDEYREQLMNVIGDKISGEHTVQPATTGKKEASSNVTDLMAALQASIDRSKPEKTKKAAPKKRKAPAKKEKNA